MPKQVKKGRGRKPGSIKWVPFWLDVDCFCGYVESRERWKIAKQDHGISKLDLSLTRRDNKASMYFKFFHGFPGQTLGEWAVKQGVSL